MLANPDALSEIVDHINQSQEPCIVVVSALKGMMPKLRILFSLALRKGQGFEEEFCAFRDTHVQLASRLLKGIQLEEYLQTMQTELDELADTLNSVAVLKDVPHALKDYVLSKGDILSSLLFSKLFEKSSWHDSRNFIVTNNNFGAPEILWEESCKATRQELEKVKGVAVVPGYCGKTADGYTISLGRVGLSLTASVLEAAFQEDVKFAV